MSNSVISLSNSNVVWPKSSLARSCEVYCLYLLILKCKYTVSEVYDMCNDIYTTKSIPYVGPFGTTMTPPPGPKETMRLWMISTLRYNGFFFYPEDISPNSLGGFIAMYSGNQIKLTLWDKIFTPIKRKLYK